MRLPRAVLLCVALALGAVLIPAKRPAPERKVISILVRMCDDGWNLGPPEPCDWVSDPKLLERIAREEAKKSRIVFVFDE